MVDVAALAVVATRLITENGRTVTLRKRTEPASPSSEPWNDADTISTVSTTGAFTLDLSALVGGTLLRRAGRECYVPAGAGTDLESYSELLDGSTIYKIADVERIAPNDILVAWRLILER